MVHRWWIFSGAWLRIGPLTKLKTEKIGLCVGGGSFVVTYRAPDGGAGKLDRYQHSTAFFSSLVPADEFILDNRS